MAVMEEINVGPLLLDDAHYIPMMVMGCTSSVLSMMGSGCILYMTTSTTKDFHDKILNRILFSLSLADFLNSTALLLMPFSVPSTIGIQGGIGTHATCTVTGFFVLLGYTAMCCYHTYLSLYYLLVVRRNWKERDFHFRLEITAHLLALSYPLMMAMTAAITQTINPHVGNPGVCTIASYPSECRNDPTVCVRSNPQWVNRLSFPTSTYVLLLSLTGFVCTGIVCSTVQNTLQRSSRYNFHPAGSQQQQDTTSQERRIQTVRVQSFLYSLASFNTFFWMLVVQVRARVYGTDLAEKKFETPHYLLALVWVMFFPLQGLLNFFVYTRQNRIKWRKAEPDRSILWIYKQILLSKPIPRNSSTLPRRNRTRAAAGSKPTAEEGVVAAHQGKSSGNSAAAASTGIDSSNNNMDNTERTARPSTTSHTKDSIETADHKYILGNNELDG